MDLAKIRKKSLLMRKDLEDERSIAPSSSPELVHDAIETVPAAPVSAKADSLQKESASMPFVASASAPPLIAPVFPERVAAMRTPLEVILAGRAAAGRDVESFHADNVSDGAVAEAPLEFLCFRVSDEIYGINIMDIKEIIKPREVTEVPRVPLFVSGILSLRGTVIPIIDMRVRLGLTREEPTGKERIVVIRNSASFSGLLVDEVIQVVQIQNGAIEAAPTIMDGIDRDFINGLGRSDGRLIIILNLENIADINLY
ncbi:MAG: chemotaxis protein CheW [Desulfuromonadaceae bacterium]